MRDMSLLLGPPITHGNAIDVLLNGDRIFPAMLAAIRAAERSITFETFIYWSGSIGSEFAEALSERARAGVSVFRVEGPTVAQMQAAFTDNWMKANGRVLHGAGYFPELETSGALSAQMFMSSPSGGSESMHLMYLMVITAASASIDMSSAYFVPDELTVNALVSAARRGVSIRIIVPGKYIDAEVVRRASRARWGPLLDAGIVIAEFQPTMYHCKMVMADDLLVSVGSTNFDNRSFRLNDEANLNVFDAKFAREQTRYFEADLTRSQQITLEAWRKRPLAEKLLEHSASLLGSQL